MKHPVERARFRRWLAGAAALHALAIGGGYARVRATDAARLRERHAVEPPPLDGDVEVTYEERSSAPSAAGPPAEEPALNEEAGPVARGERARSERRAAPSNRAAEGAAPVAPAPGPAGSSDPSGYTLDPMAKGEAAARSSVDLGIEPGQWARWVDAAPTAKEQAERNVAESIDQALAEHDREVGLGPSGAVKSAFREATRSDAAPQLGTATFRITVLRTGEIAVDLLDASGQRAAWSSVGDGAAEILKRRPPHFFTRAKGVRLVLLVVADERWANGASTRGRDPSFGVKLPSVRSTEDAQRDLEAKNPAAAPPAGAHPDAKPLVANTELVGPVVSGQGRICNYGVGLGLAPTTPGNPEGAARFGPFLAGGCDPSNGAGPASRVVSMRVLSETSL